MRRRLRSALAETIPFSGVLAGPLPGPAESGPVLRRRRRVVGATALVGAGLLGRSLSTEPGSKQFYAGTAAVAGVWTIGGFLSGPLHRGWIRREGRVLERPVITPLATGVGAFGAFYAAALVARRIPVLHDAIAGVLQYADQGDERLVYATTLANGVAEEVFFRGALYAALPGNPVAATTAVYAVSTSTTKNPALVLAAAVMGSLFGLQRRASGGLQAPVITHITWSTLMLRFLPRLFPAQHPDPPTPAVPEAR